MVKRRKRIPDNRLDWRDPDMPVLDDGVKKTPEQFQRERTRSLIAASGYVGSRNFPDWKNDPGYYGWKKNK